jgi:PAS domain S-box-containing protein
MCMIWSDKTDAHEALQEVAVRTSPAPTALEMTNRRSTADGSGSSRPVSDELLRLMVDSIEDYGIVILDPGGHIMTWNEGAARISGYAAGEVLGRHVSLFHPSEDIESGTARRALADAARTGCLEEEGWRVRKDGSRIWAHVTLTALRSPEGELVGFAKVTRDLTDRLTAEDEMRRFRLLVETVEDYAIFMLDTEGRVSSWNAGAQRIKGYRQDEIVGKHFSIFYPREDVAAGKCELELDVAVREGRFEDEGWRVRKDGRQFWANVVITALRDADGAPIGFAKVTRDLTERRAAEEMRRALAVETAALAEKTRTQEFQERFLAILGHDLRNPLSSIDMGAQLLRQRAADPAAARVLDRMHASALRMARMIEQILDLTRARLAGGLVLNRKPMDLRDALVHVVEELRSAHPASAITLDCTSATGVWDQDRIEQIFSNLISNAVDYGDPAKPVTVEGRVEGHMMTIEVRNEGEPISPGLQTQIFSPFRRGDRDSRTPKTSGLGLGLYISSEIVAAHGGTMEVRSSLAEGTVFSVTLPVGTTAAR